MRKMIAILAILLLASPAWGLNLSEIYPAAGDGAVGAWGTPTAVTVAGGVLALSGEGYYTVETEGAAASDDVTSITGLVSGDEIILAPVHNDRTVVIKAGATIIIDADFTMNNTADRIGLQCIGSDTVVELGRANGGD